MSWVGFAKEKRGEVADRGTRSLSAGGERSSKDCGKEARTEETTVEQSKIREQEGCLMFFGSCCQTPVSVSLLASSSRICVINEKHLRCHWVCLGRAAQKGLLRYLGCCTLLLLMTFSSSDLLPPPWKATLSPTFLGILTIIFLFFFPTLSLYHFFPASYPF